ncbi:rRNA maturation RNase YbeY [Hankyongella ginsenosidimutans]|uniref:Endoribonuclease YbeY n=1 Tax=Hankyongella ginsenosidimutans TaxID=1763828 RepID=A0A4D7C499_9SPHN|nr:rRNA maturation RNase YbeY [Hankyongella ginsenosidimutans]QCI80544.1 rRNA maturation RNase YbeY [Hankyongella ginsenosidimutans]
MLRIALEIAEDRWSETGLDWNALACAVCDAALKATPFEHWSSAAEVLEVSVQLTNDAEVQELNRDYRGKDKPTNVLSFPMIEMRELADGLLAPEQLLGDVVLALETVAAEAAAQGKTLRDHGLHLIAHGFLHLLGYDHETGAADAEAMEALERRALAELNVADPYGE